MIMIRKYYDIILEGGYGGIYVINEENKEASTVIECECGTHLLKVQSDATIYTNNDKSQQVRQSFYFAMFNYGYTDVYRWGRRIKIAWRFLRTGKMFSDQLCLTSDEAQKLSDFIKTNKVETEIK